MSKHIVSSNGRATLWNAEMMQNARRYMRVQHALAEKLRTEQAKLK